MTESFLTPTEQAELASHEAIIARGLKTFMEVGTALLAIREARLYRCEFTRFEDYCEQRWFLTQPRVYQLMKAAEVMGVLKSSTIVELLPANEAQARPLTSLTPDNQRAAWMQAVATAPNGKLTAAHIEAVAEQFKPATVRSFDPDQESEEVVSDESDDLPPVIEEETNPTISSNGRHKPKTNRVAEESDPSPLFDRCQTPAKALDPLLPYLDPAWVIWEPAAGEGLLVEGLYDSGYTTVLSSDVLTGQDFFTYTPDQVWDCLITNPPYSIKYRWLERCYQLGKPFALLLPVETLGAMKAQVLFRLHGIEIVLLDQRINFKMPNLGWDGNGAQFPTAWFTWGLGIGQQMTFAHVKRGSDE